VEGEEEVEANVECTKQKCGNHFMTDFRYERSFENVVLFVVCLSEVFIIGS
jgi:hypothetical protein